MLYRYVVKSSLILLVLLPVFWFVPTVFAAKLSISPNTGVFSVGNTFTVRAVINTEGESINAAEGSLSFNARELAVVSISKNGSIFNLWTEEPTYSNSAGTVTFGGGSPSGYSGGNGTIMSITFRSLNSGTPKINYSSGSVLAADGLGTNVLSGMNGGAYTINAVVLNTEPEVVYVPPPNTPLAPLVTSATHPDQDAWYRHTSVTFAWSLSSGVTALRTLFDSARATIPTILYEDLLSEITIGDLEEGISYFHIQFRNAEGWGPVTHYKIGVDQTPPESFFIEESKDVDSKTSRKQLLFTAKDNESGISHYMVSIDGDVSKRFDDDMKDGLYVVPPLGPGHHSILVEAYDFAGNMLPATFAFNIEAFEAPIFTDVPSVLNEGVIPVFKGKTRPESTVRIKIQKIDSSQSASTEYQVHSNIDGEFVLIPDGSFKSGVYELTAVATDIFGNTSLDSEAVRIMVQLPGYMRLGGILINILSVIVPLLSLSVVLIVGVWYLWHKLIVMRRRIKKEVVEAEQQLALEFDDIVSKLKKSVLKLKKTRKGNLTKAEQSLITTLEDDLQSAELRIRKEIEDIDVLVSK